MWWGRSSNQVEQADDVKLYESGWKERYYKSKFGVDINSEEGAKVIKDRAKKGIVDNQLADIAFNNEKYDVAESAYKEVIKNSLTKEKIENAHIQILKISR